MRIILMQFGECHDMSSVRPMEQKKSSHWYSHNLTHFCDPIDSQVKDSAQESRSDDFRSRIENPRVLKMAMSIKEFHHLNICISQMWLCRTTFSLQMVVCSARGSCVSNWQVGCTEFQFKEGQTLPSSIKKWNGVVTSNFLTLTGSIKKLIDFWLL